MGRMTSHIRRPRQTQGGARQGIIHLTLFLNGRSRSSRTKKELKSSFSMGFRSYIRHFWGAVSEFFSPSLPWGFAARSGLLLGVAASHQQQQFFSEFFRPSLPWGFAAGSGSLLGVAASHQQQHLWSLISMGFRSYIRHFWGAIFSKLFRLSLPWGFAAGSGSLLAVAASHQQQQQQPQQQQPQQQQQQSKVDWIGLDF